jgi:intein-encoded DNA endonuclease-like protein
MKKLVVSLAMFVAVFGTALAADGTKISYRVEEAFKKEFAGATSVKWEVIRKHDLFQAHFIYNNERINAFFDVEGNLIATGRFIAVANLPLLLRKNVFQKFKSFQIKDVIEFVQGNETSYLVSIENEKSKLLVHGYANGYSYIFKKEKKNSLAKL